MKNIYRWNYNDCYDHGSHADHGDHDHGSHADHGDHIHGYNSMIPDSGLSDHDYSATIKKGSPKEKYEQDNNFRAAVIHVLLDAFVSCLVIIELIIVGQVKHTVIIHINWKWS